MTKFHFNHSKLRKQPFLANNLVRNCRISKSRGACSPLPMPVYLFCDIAVFYHVMTCVACFEQRGKLSSDLFPGRRCTESCSPCRRDDLTAYVEARNMRTGARTGLLAAGLVSGWVGNLNQSPVRRLVLGGRWAWWVSEEVGAGATSLSRKKVKRK